MHLPVVVMLCVQQDRRSGRVQQKEEKRYEAMYTCVRVCVCMSVCISVRLCAQTSHNIQYHITLPLVRFFLLSSSTTLLAVMMPEMVNLTHYQPHNQTVSIVFFLYCFTYTFLSRSLIEVDFNTIICVVFFFWFCHGLCLPTCLICVRS